MNARFQVATSVLILMFIPVLLAAEVPNEQDRPAAEPNRTVLPIDVKSSGGSLGPTGRESAPPKIEPVRAPQNAPNVVIVLLDDVGFGAAGTFGGPVATPAMESLAAEGLRYNRFHTTAK